VDGTVLPISGDVAWSTGKFNRMPIMNGAVADEGAFTASIGELFFGTRHGPTLLPGRDTGQGNGEIPAKRLSDARRGMDGSRHRLERVPPVSTMVRHIRLTSSSCSRTGMVVLWGSRTS